MKLRLTAEHEDEIRAIVGWIQLSMLNKVPALTRFDIQYLSYFEGGKPKEAIIELEFNDPTK